MDFFFSHKTCFLIPILDGVNDESKQTESSQRAKLAALNSQTKLCFPAGLSL